MATSELVGGQDERKPPTFGRMGLRQRRQGSFDLGGPVNQSLRRLGQLLVVMGALLGAITGVALALIVEDAENSRAVVVSGRERAAVLAANPSSSQPPASRAAGSGNRPAGNDSAGNQHGSCQPL
jgi:putative intracellular protease/amidase